MLLLTLSTALAAPNVLASSARLVGPPPAAFEWPEATPACRAELHLGADGVVARVEHGKCVEALHPVLDGLVGLAFEPPAQGGALLEVRLVPPDGERGSATPVLRPLEVGPVEWPDKWPDTLGTVPAKTFCPVTVSFVNNERPTTFAVESCPELLKKTLEKELAKTAWKVRSALPAPDGWTARVVFAWVDDPARPYKRLMAIEGTAVPKTVVTAGYPVGMTGAASCMAAVQVESSGTPLNVTVGGCEPAWERAARAAVQKWTFMPRLVDGEPTTDDYVTTVTFSLN